VYWFPTRVQIPVGSLLTIFITVWFACRNAVDDVNFLEFLNMCHHLQWLTLAGCPASFRAGYRATVRRLLPNLITLDGIPVAQNGTFVDLRISHCFFDLYEDFNIIVFLHTTSCSLVGKYQCTEGIYFLDLLRGRKCQA
jgi:hypothetical protein